MRKGVRQGDRLSATLYNIVLEGVVRDCGMQGMIAQKAAQIVAYTGDTV